VKQSDKGSKLQGEGEELRGMEGKSLLIPLFLFVSKRK